LFSLQPLLFPPNSPKTQQNPRSPDDENALAPLPSSTSTGDIQSINHHSHPSSSSIGVGSGAEDPLQQFSFLSHLESSPNASADAHMHVSRRGPDTPLRVPSANNEMEPKGLKDSSKTRDVATHSGERFSSLLFHLAEFLSLLSRAGHV